MTVDIVGAGFSGLVTAFYLTEKGVVPRVFEKERRPGGLISTKRMPSGLIETAANAFLNSDLVEEMAAKIGLDLLATKHEARTRFIYRGRPRRWPLSVRASGRVAFALSKIVLKSKEVRPEEGETIREWGVRILGKEGTRYLLEPALQGIYAGDPTEMSASLILSKFLSRGKRKKPKIFGSVSPPEGMGQFIDKLEKYLVTKGVEFKYSSTLKAADYGVLKTTEVATKAADSGTDPGVSPAREISKVIYCGSARGAAEWLREAAPVTARALSKIDVRPVTTITAFFEPHAADVTGFGILFPRDQDFQALGVLFNGHIFEGRSALRSETWIYSGVDAGLESVISDRKKLGGWGNPIEFEITRWPHAIPHYTVDLEALLRTGIELPPNIKLVGNYLGDLGLTKILDRAKRTVDEILK
ncbi:MAG: FAD-dependent oxidoreductase [Bdellovibrionia bacterium]